MKTTLTIERLQSEVPEGFTVRPLHHEIDGTLFRYGLWDAQGDLWCWWNTAAEFEEALAALTEAEMEGDLSDG